MPPQAPRTEPLGTGGSTGWGPRTLERCVACPDSGASSQRSPSLGGDGQADRASGVKVGLPGTTGSNPIRSSSALHALKCQRTPRLGRAGGHFPSVVRFSLVSSNFPSIHPSHRTVGCGPPPQRWPHFSATLVSFAPGSVTDSLRDPVRVPSLLRLQNGITPIYLLHSLFVECFGIPGQAERTGGQGWEKALGQWGLEKQPHTPSPTVPGPQLHTFLTVLDKCSLLPSSDSYSGALGLCHLLAGGPSLPFCTASHLKAPQTHRVMGSSCEEVGRHPSQE